jgi:hypothetical protein
MAEKSKSPDKTLCTLHDGSQCKNLMIWWHTHVFHFVSHSLLVFYDKMELLKESHPFIMPSLLQFGFVLADIVMVDDQNAELFLFPLSNSFIS